VSVVRNTGLPFSPDPREKILLIGQFPDFLAEGKLRFPQADTLLFPFSPFYGSRPEDRARVPAQTAGYDTVIFCVANFNSLEVLQTLKGSAKRIIVMSALTPIYLADVPWVKTAVAVYGSGKDSFRAGFAVLAGDFDATTRLPIDFGIRGVK
jgi:beta-N-acetylhexosaminidase